MKFVNCTPHTIALNNGTSFPPSGQIARVSVTHTEFVAFRNDDDPDGAKIPVCDEYFGLIEGLPEPEEGTRFIVSAMVLAASRIGRVGQELRLDLFAPATGHKDCVRNEKGHIISVPGLVR